jgi:voltage-gated potassium channel Kch
VPRQPLERLIQRIFFGRKELSILRASYAIGAVTLVVTVGGAFLIRFADRSNFPNVWLGIWWALQTLTTVGYGDVVPQGTFGKTVASVVMLVGIALIAVFTALITAAFVENARRKHGADPVLDAVQDLARRLDVLERTLARDDSGRVSPTHPDRG